MFQPGVGLGGIFPPDSTGKHSSPGPVYCKGAGKCQLVMCLRQSRGAWAWRTPGNPVPGAASAGRSSALRGLVG